MRRQSASELNPDFAQYIRHPGNRRTHLCLKFVLLSMLVIDRVLDRGDAQFMLANFDRQIRPHLLNIRAKAEIARDRPGGIRIVGRSR